MKKTDPTFLVIEDNQNDQQRILRGFKKIGVTSRIFMLNNGLEAIAYMMGEGKYSDRKAFPYPTFIITDLRMPGADGFAVLEFLKANPEWAVIPTVVVSDSSDLDDVKKAYMLGASSYHIKPSTETGLTHLLIVLHAYWIRPMHLTQVTTMGCGGSISPRPPINVFAGCGSSRTACETNR